MATKDKNMNEEGSLEEKRKTSSTSPVKLPTYSNKVESENSTSAKLPVYFYSAASVGVIIYVIYQLFYCGCN